MDVQPHPTSPKRQSVQTTEPKVWNDRQQFEQPRRIPWLGIILVVILLNIVITGGLVVGWGWFTRHATHTRWLEWLPQLTSTTVIQQTNSSGVVITAPSRVTQAVSNTLTVASALGADALYTPSQGVGFAIPLSSDGWALTLADALPKGAIAILPPTGLALTGDTTVDDPATAFLFVKTDHINADPAVLTTEAPTIGQTVWVAAGNVQDMTVVQRHIVNVRGPRWLSSDRQEQTWQLDQPVTTLIGAPVFNGRGQVIGLLGQDNHVWPAVSVASVVDAVVQRGQLVRPSVGLRYLMLDQAIGATTTEEQGALVGADTNVQPVQLKGAADVAGVKSGDVISAIDGQPLRTDFRQIVAGYKPGQTMSLTILRGQKTLTVKVTVSTLTS